MLIWYGPLARFADWFHGFRDGGAGIPGRPPPRTDADDGRPAALRTVPRWRIATTAHREYLIRMAQDAFERERVRYEAGRAATARRLQEARVRQSAAAAALAEAEAAAVIASRPLGEEEETRRGLGETRHPLWFIRLRRRRDRQRRIAAAEQQVAAARGRLSRIDAEVAAAEQEERSQRAVAGARVRRIHEHYERRIASYRRTLVRYHPDGEWVNHVIGVLDPSIPAWLNTGIVPESAPDEARPGPPEEQPDPQALDPIALGEGMSFGADPAGPGHYHISYYWAAPRHFEMRRRADGYDLVVLVSEHGPYIGDQQARRTTRLRDGDGFEFGGVRYELAMTDEGGWLRRRPTRPSDLIVYDMSANTRKQPRLTRMSVVQRSGTVMAILGPSGAGKTSLFYALMNELKPSRGEFYLGNRRVVEHAERFREELGFVPQYDDMHTTLTVRRLLLYSDRLHRRARRADRAARIDRVLKELRVYDRRDRLASSLSGGQRKRVSIAMELLREPRILMLDEPTSGLDAGLDREVMRYLNRVAVGAKSDGGRPALVIVITHTTNYLRYAQQVLVVARGGRPIFAGPPEQLRPALQMTEYADLMDLLEDPERVAVVDAMAADYLESSEMVRLAQQEAARARAAGLVGAEHWAVRAWRATGRFCRQLPVMIQRQVHLLLARGSTRTRADRGLWDWVMTPMRAGLPLLTAAGGAAIVGMVAKDEGLGPGHSAVGALGLLTTVCLFASQSMTSTDIVAEFPIIRRERRTGAATAAVVVSKWLVFAVIAVLQALIITAVFVSFRPGPTNSHVFAPTTELFLNLAGLCVAAMTLGLLISTIAKKVEQAVLVNALVMIGEIALNGASTDLSDSPAAPLAALLPARWGVAAAASSTDMRTISTAAPPDALWDHTTGQWITNAVMLGALTLAFFTLTLVWLRRRLSHPD